MQYIHNPLSHTRHPVRPGAARLLTDAEYSRVRDSTWNTPYLFVTTRTTVRLVDVPRDYSTSLE